VENPGLRPCVRYLCFFKSACTTTDKIISVLYAVLVWRDAQARGCIPAAEKTSASDLFVCILNENFQQRCGSYFMLRVCVVGENFFASCHNLRAAVFRASDAKSLLGKLWTSSRKKQNKLGNYFWPKQWTFLYLRTKALGFNKTKQ